MPLTSQPVNRSAREEERRGAGMLGHARELFRMRVDKSTARVGLAAICFAGLFCVIGGRLVYLAVTSDTSSEMRRVTSSEISAARPDIVDRNGEILATDVKMVSVFAEPRNIIDKDEAVELLTAVLPDLDATDLRNKLGTKKGFVWVKREITPRQQAEVHRLGIPGVGFLPENKRIYPNAEAAAHVLGFANVDNVGIAGIEKYIDSQGSAGSQRRRLQHHLGRSQAGRALHRSARSACPARRTAEGHGEVQGQGGGRRHHGREYGRDDRAGVAAGLRSKQSRRCARDDRINRINVGVFEMGSTFKALTTAMALDSGKFNINSSLDARVGSALRQVHDRRLSRDASGI